MIHYISHPHSLSESGFPWHCENTVSQPQVSLLVQQYGREDHTVWASVESGIMKKCLKEVRAPSHCLEPHCPLCLSNVHWKSCSVGMVIPNFLFPPSVGQSFSKMLLTVAPTWQHASYLGTWFMGCLRDGQRLNCMDSLMPLWITLMPTFLKESFKQLHAHAFDFSLRLMPIIIKCLKSNDAHLTRAPHLSR